MQHFESFHFFYRKYGVDLSAGSLIFILSFIIAIIEYRKWKKRQSQVDFFFVDRVNYQVIRPVLGIGELPGFD